jgi:hypothetical protein
VAVVRSVAAGGMGRASDTFWWPCTTLSKEMSERAMTAMRASYAGTTAKVGNTFGPRPS